MATPGRLVGISASAALLLAACGESDGTRAPASSEDPTAAPQRDSAGPSGAVDGPDSPPPPTESEPGGGAGIQGFPAYAQPYPDAAMLGSQSARNEGERGGMLSFTSQAAPDTIVAWYGQRAERAGLNTAGQVRQGDTRSFQAESDRGESLVVVVTPAEGRASVLVTWSSPG